MGNDIITVSEDVRNDLSMARAPQQVLDEALKAAKALQSVITQKSKPVLFNGEQYIEFEDWQVLGKFYGVTAEVISTEPINIDGVKGFLAKARAVDASGRTISAAESMCLNDEPNWSRKPLFQLRSMAQTRACAKSLRNVLAWVVVMAGYRPNVAEELAGQEGFDSTPPPPAPKRASESKPQAAAPTGDKISDPQRKRFYAISKGSGKTDDEIKAYLTERIGSSHSADIPKAEYEAICAWAEDKSNNAQ